MKGKKVRRLLPCDIFAVGALEHWLGDMSQEGLRLESLGETWAVFRKAEQRRCRYRMYPNGYPEQKQQELFQELGWEYVTMLRSDFSIFCCEDPAAPELCTDPVVDAETYRSLYKKLRFRLLWLLVYPFLYCGFFMLMNGALYEDIWRGQITLVHAFAGGFEVLLALLLMLGLMITKAVYAFRNIHAVRQRLAKGQPIDHAAPYPAKRRRLPLSLMEGPAIALLAATLCWMNGAKETPVLRVPDPVPAPLLANVEGEGFSYGDRAWRESYVQTMATILAESFCESRQTGGETAGLLWMDSTYIRVRAQGMAEPVFRSLRDVMVRDSTSTSIFGAAEPVQPGPGETRFEEIALFERRREFDTGEPSAREWLVIARRGKQVLGVLYTGDQPLARLLDEVDETMRRFEQG